MGMRPSQMTPSKEKPQTMLSALLGEPNSGVPFANTSLAAGKRDVYNFCLSGSLMSDS
jgi:hypothetical protein